MARNLKGSAVSLTAGCKKDIEKLLSAFKKEESFSFDAFSKCFRESDFFTIFMGRLNGAEVLEFSEKLLKMAVSYAMSFRKRKPENYASDVMDIPTGINGSGEYTLQERIFGIYLTYSLYYVQPGSYVSQIRITPEQAHDVASFVGEILLPCEYYDAVLAYFRLVYFGAFSIIAFEEEHNPLLQKRLDKNLLDEGIVPQFEDLSLFKSFADEPLLTQVDLIHERYQAAKKDYGLASTSVFDVVKRSVSELYEEVLKNSQKRERRASAHGGKTLASPSKISRSSLKEKAYKTRTVHPRHRRHRASSGISTSALEKPSKEGGIVQASSAQGEEFSSTDAVALSLVPIASLSMENSKGVAGRHKKQKKKS